MTFFDSKRYNWWNYSPIIPKSFICGFCGNLVSSKEGYYIKSLQTPDMLDGNIYICPGCQGPNFFPPYLSNKQYPGPSIGNEIKNLPENLKDIYEETRECYKNNCFTAVVMLCRKILMHIAVDQGEKDGKKFIEYVDYLSNAGFIPPNGKKWVDHIRSKGNEANHEIVIMKEVDAKDLIGFVEMLLKFVYEFPNMIQ